MNEESRQAQAAARGACQIFTMRSMRQFVCAAIFARPPVRHPCTGNRSTPAFPKGAVFRR